MFLPEGSLRIERAQLYDGGMYECVAINTAGNDTKMMELHVQGESSTRPKTLNKFVNSISYTVPPSIENPSNAQVVSLLGEEGVLPCVVSGEPHPSIRWRKGSQEIDFYSLFLGSCHCLL